MHSQFQHLIIVIMVIAVCVTGCPPYGYNQLFPVSIQLSFCCPRTVSTPVSCLPLQENYPNRHRHGKSRRLKKKTLFLLTQSVAHWVIPHYQNLLKLLSMYAHTLALRIITPGGGNKLHLLSNCRASEAITSLSERLTSQSRRHYAPIHTNSIFSRHLSLLTFHLCLAINTNNALMHWNVSA